MIKHILATYGEALQLVSLKGHGKLSRVEINRLPWHVLSDQVTKNQGFFVH